MDMTPQQCRMARAALEWSGSDLAAKANVGLNTVSRFEQGGDARRSSVAALQAAFEAEGITFVGKGEASLAGGAGVRHQESGK